MQIDLFGKRRCKVNLHMHTTLSDGGKTPDEALAIYKNAGYDAVAITDHWHFGESGEFDGMTVLSGVEYNTRGGDGIKGLFHIVGIGLESEPDEISRDSSGQELIDAIRAHGGLAVVAHPAWSLNPPDVLAGLRNVDATEIYNSISGVYMSRRADSSLILDMLACRGVFWPLLATDDVHYYDLDGPVSWIMAECAPTREGIISAVREGRFYATQGPEVHIERDGDCFVIRSSPVREIIIFSNMAWAPRAFTGDGLTEARYKIYGQDAFVRAEVTDAEGRKAWTNFVCC